MDVSVYKLDANSTTPANDGDFNMTSRMQPAAGSAETEPDAASYSLKTTETSLGVFEMERVT